MPAIERSEPSVVKKFEDEHLAGHLLSDRLKHLLNIFRTAENDPDKLMCGSAIAKAFVEFMVFNLEHMAREELIINEVLWKEYTDGEIQFLTRKITENIPPAEKAMSAKWFLKGVNHIEAIQWLKQVKETLPDSLFEKILGIAETELPELSREKVLVGVREPELSVY
jgi:hypothetical protein